MFDLFKKKKQEYSLLVDMGGTNIRLGLTRNGRTFEQTTILKAAEFKSFDEALTFYLKQTKEKPGHLLMAAAGALYNDTISLSNNPWIISKKEIQRRFSFQKVTLINDFVAQALAVPLIPEEKKIQITDRGEVQKKAAILVIGPGTGLGVSALVPNENAPGGFFPVPSEGGHISAAPQNKKESELIEGLRKSYQHISVERIVSGNGLKLLYGHYLGKKHSLKSEEISALAREGDKAASQALLTMMDFLGAAAGDLALAFNTFGGVYLAGGLLQNEGMLGFLKKSNFRKRFEEKGRMSLYLEKIPTYLIADPLSAFAGLGTLMEKERKKKH